MSDVNTASGLLNVALELNLKWLARLGLNEPIVLKNVYIADTNSNFPLSQITQINVALHPEITIANRVSVSTKRKKFNQIWIYFCNGTKMLTLTSLFRKSKHHALTSKSSLRKCARE